jgi:CHAT domain-containing protein
VREIAGLYPAPAVLAGADASPDRLRGALGRAGTVHYAGHAVFDDARPERSYLLLAGAGERGRMSAEEVARMDLRGVRLVVLSACETVRATDGRAGGFAGFAGALLQAGAGGVVGSTWRVEDEATRRLMVAFHQRYRASGDPAAALREAQLAMLRSSDPEHRSAATWASFRYAGN